MRHRVEWSTNPGDLPPAVAGSLARCPTCGEAWPEDVPTTQLTTCDEPKPWSCTLCGARLLWLRTALACPTHGTISRIPSWPTDGRDEQ